MKSQKRIFIKKKKHLKPVMPSVDKGHFPDFIRKEIFTQPELINALIERYVRAEKINFDYLKIKIDKIKRIYLVGNGENYGCVLAGAYNFEVLVDIPCSASLISEFRFSNPVLDKSTLVIMVSKSKDDEYCAETIKRINESGAKIIEILNFEPENNTAVNLNFIEKGAVSTAGYTLRYTALSMLALYFGEKNQVITELYVKIATKMLQSLHGKIKYVLENEYLIRHMAEKINTDKLITAGTNVDFACAIYTSYLFTFAMNRNIRAFPVGELRFLKSDTDTIIGFASNENFYNVLIKSVKNALKIVPKNIAVNDSFFIDYDDTIPLFNPILSAVVSQLMAYNIAKENNIILDNQNN